MTRVYTMGYYSESISWGWYDNTNTSIFEMSPYVLAGKAYGFEVKIIRLICDPNVAAARTSHGATPRMVKEMNDRMEANPSLYPPEEVRTID